MKKKPTKTLTTQTDPRWCPVCFQLLDAVTSMLGEHKPVPGDFTICIGCASVLCFDERMDFRVSSLDAIPTHSRMMFARMVQAVRTRNNARPIRIC